MIQQPRSMTPMEAEKRSFGELIQNAERVDKEHMEGWFVATRTKRATMTTPGSAEAIKAVTAVLGALASASSSVQGPAKDKPHGKGQSTSQPRGKLVRPTPYATHGT